MPAIVSGSSLPSQLRSRSSALRSRWPAGASRPSRRAASSPRIERLSDCIALEALDVVLVGLSQQLLDPLRPEAVDHSLVMWWG